MKSGEHFRNKYLCGRGGNKDGFKKIPAEWNFL